MTFDEQRVEATIAALRSEFAPFILYRIQKAAVDLGENADVSVQQLEHAEDAFIAWLRTTLTTYGKEVLEEQSREWQAFINTAILPHLPPQVAQTISGAMQFLTPTTK